MRRIKKLTGDEKLKNQIEVLIVACNQISIWFVWAIFLSI